MVDHSVIIFSYNQGRYLASCIESVLEQSEPPGEVIVYDGGSSDGSIEILERYASSVRTIAGQAGQLPPLKAEALGRETAFRYSSGRIIFLLDASDRFKPGKIEHYAAAFDRRPDASLVQSPIDLIDDDGVVQGTYFDARYHVADHLREIYQHHDLNLFYPTSALAFSRHYLERVLPFEVEDGMPLWTDARLCIPAAYFGHIVTLTEPYTERRCPLRGVTARGFTPLSDTIARTRLFNTFCRRHGLKRIAVVRNRRFYLELLRCMLPRLASSFLDRGNQRFAERV